MRDGHEHPLSDRIESVRIPGPPRDLRERTLDRAWRVFEESAGRPTLWQRLRRWQVELAMATAIALGLGLIPFLSSDEARRMEDNASLTAQKSQLDEMILPDLRWTNAFRLRNQVASQRNMNHERTLGSFQVDVFVNNERNEF